MLGVVTYYDYNKGYVFLRSLGEDSPKGEEYFFHVTQLGVSRLWGLGVGSVVEFEPADGGLVKRVSLTH
jgi:cold shock CspA family protein